MLVLRERFGLRLRSIRYIYFFDIITATIVLLASTFHEIVVQITWSTSAKFF